MLVHTVLRLFPAPQETVALKGLYLSQRLHEVAATEDTPLVYTNFLTSLDGRIALRDPDTRVREIPAAIQNPRDWRLYQELGAQADILITSGQYVRAVATGRITQFVRIGAGEDYADLPAWRHAQGLSAHPAIAIVSRTLDIPVPDSLLALGQPIYAIAGEWHRKDRDNCARLAGHGVEVLFAGSGTRVEGERLVQALAARGFRSLYCIAGPQILYLLLQARALARLYLTVNHQILGGEDFATLVTGPQCPTRLTLTTLYHDASIPHEAGQFFAHFRTA